MVQVFVKCSMGLEGSWLTGRGVALAYRGCQDTAESGGQVRGDNYSL